MIVGLEGAIVGGERYLEKITTLVLNHGNVSEDHSGSVTENLTESVTENPTGSDTESPTGSDTANTFFLKNLMWLEQSIWLCEHCACTISIRQKNIIFPNIIITAMNCGHRL